MSEGPEIVLVAWAERAHGGSRSAVQRSLARTDAVTSVSSLTPKALANKT